MSESAQALNVSLRHAYNRKLLNRQLHKFCEISFPCSA